MIEEDPLVPLGYPPRLASPTRPQGYKRKTIYSSERRQRDYGWLCNPSCGTTHGEKVIKHSSKRDEKKLACPRRGLPSSPALAGLDGNLQLLVLHVARPVRMKALCGCLHGAKAPTRRRAMRREEATRAPQVGRCAHGALALNLSCPASRRSSWRYLPARCA